MGIIIRGFFFLTALFVTLSVHAQTDEKIDTEFLPKFHQSLEYPKIDEPLYQTLSYLGSIRLSSSTPLHRKIFGDGLTGEVYLNSLKPVKKFIFIPTAHKGLVAYARRKSSTILLTDQFQWADKSIIDFASLLVHEAHHLKENKGVVHKKCPEMSLEGEPLIGHDSSVTLNGLKACDNVIASTFGIQSIMLDNISRYCTTCLQQERERAHVLSRIYRKRIIGKTAFAAILNDQDSPLLTQAQREESL